MDRLARRREILNDKSAMFSMLPNELLYMLCFHFVIILLFGFRPYVKSWPTLSYCHFGLWE